MSAFVRINTDQFYLDGVLLPSTFWQTLDTNQSKAWNGDLGGTWTPTGNTIIAGAGMWCAGPWTIGASALLATTLASGTRYVHGDNDYIVLATGHGAAIYSVIVELPDKVWDISGGTARMNYDNGHDAIVNQVPNASFVAGGRIIVELDVHNGATFTQVLLNWYVGQNHASLPQSQPQFRVYKVDKNGAVTPLKTAGVTTGGWLQNADGTAAAYYNSGNLKSNNYVLDAGVVVDTTQFAYFLEWVDEQGTNAMSGNLFQTATCTMTAIADLHPQ